MRHRPARHTRGFVTRVAVASAASLAVVASSGTVALAEDTTSNDEVDPSSQTTETGHEQDSMGNDDAALETPAEAATEEGATAELESETAPEVEQAPDDDPGTDLEGGGDVEDVDEVDPPVVVPTYGTQKVRIGVQQVDGSYIPPGASLVGTTMSITITGAVDELGEALPDETTQCIVDTENGDEDSRSANCDVVGGEDYLYLDPGETATIVPTTVPAGVLLAPGSQVVAPCLVDDCIDFPSSKPVIFDATGTPVSTTAVTTEGQPVVVNVVTPLDLGPDNAVTGVTVTAQSPNGTATVTGELPPVPEEPIVPDDVTAPVAAAANAGTSRIVFTPNAGFAGTTTFGYAVATQNGTLTGVATITVNAAAVVTPPAGPAAPGTAGNVSTATRVRTADGTLPSTGGPAGELLGLGALLVVAGAGAMAARRRQSRGLVG